MPHDYTDFPDHLDAEEAADLLGVPARQLEDGD